jgi:hypothetical protein
VIVEVDVDADVIAPVIFDVHVNVNAHLDRDRSPESLLPVSRRRGADS